MSISNKKFFCKKCSDGANTLTGLSCNPAIRNGYTCDEYDPNKKNEIIEEINNEWKRIEGDKLGPTNYLNSRTLNIRGGKIIMRGEDKNDVEKDIELKKIYNQNNNTATWEFKIDGNNWLDLFSEYFYDKPNESINHKGKKLMKENMDRIPQMIDDKLREFNFYTVDPKKGKQKVSFTDEDREMMKTNFIDMSEKYPEDIAFIRAVVSCRDIDDKTNQPYIRLGSYRDTSNVNLPFSKRINGLERVLDGGVNYFTIVNNPGPDNRDFKIVPGDKIKDVEFDQNTKETIHKPLPQQPIKKEEPFEEVMKGKEKKGLESLIKKDELTNDLTKSQKKIIEKLKREGYLFKQPVDEVGYKKMKVKSKEFTETFEVWKKVVNMNIRESLRKNIQVLEEQKRITLTEEKIVKGRLSVLPKNVNKNSVIQVNKTFNSLFTEIRKLKTIGISQKVINENLVSVLSQMFNDEGPRFIETVKDKLTDYLKTKLNLTELESGILQRAIGKTEVDDVAELFNDPRFLAQKISQTYSEDLSNMYTMLDDRGRKDVIKSIESSLIQKLEPLMGNVNSNMELKLKDIRDNIIS